MAATDLLECVPTSLAVKPSLSFSIRVTIAQMSSRILVDNMGRVAWPCAMLFTVVGGETDGKDRRRLTVATHAMAGNRVGSPDLCMVTVFLIESFFWRWSVMETEIVSVMVLVHLLWVVPEREYLQERIAKKRAPMRRRTQAQHNSVMA
eukprot:10286156-Ditylum_brightwellii.AAC.1